MNFKQALIAHLQGEHVVCRYKPTPGEKWKSLWHEFRDSAIGCIDNDSGTDDYYEFRLAPLAIMCNGVEVPAGESKALKHGQKYYIPAFGTELMYVEYEWCDDSADFEYLKNGLVYLATKEAIARAEAMLIVQEVK